MYAFFEAMRRASQPSAGTLYTHLSSQRAATMAPYIPTSSVNLTPQSASQAPTSHPTTPTTHLARPPNPSTLLTASLMLTNPASGLSIGIHSATSSPLAPMTISRVFGHCLVLARQPASKTNFIWEKKELKHREPGTGSSVADRPAHRKSRRLKTKRKASKTSVCLLNLPLAYRVCHYRASMVTLHPRHSSPVWAHFPLRRFYPDLGLEALLRQYQAWTQPCSHSCFNNMAAHRTHNFHLRPRRAVYQLISQSSNFPPTSNFQM